MALQIFSKWINSERRHSDDNIQTRAYRVIFPEQTCLYDKNLCVYSIGDVSLGKIHGIRYIIRQFEQTKDNRQNFYFFCHSRHFGALSSGALVIFWHYCNLSFGRTCFGAQDQLDMLGTRNLSFHYSFHFGILVFGAWNQLVTRGLTFFFSLFLLQSCS